MQVPLSVPPHCRVTELRIDAETEEAFDAAAKQFDVTEKILTVGPIATGEATGYSFRFVETTVEGVRLKMQGPHKQHKITVVDA